MLRVHNPEKIILPRFISCFCVDVIKHHDQKHLVEERVCFGLKFQGAWVYDDSWRHDRKQQAQHISRRLRDHISNKIKMKFLDPAHLLLPELGWEPGTGENAKRCFGPGQAQSKYTTWLGVNFFTMHWRFRRCRRPRDSVYSLLWWEHWDEGDAYFTP